MDSLFSLITGLALVYLWYVPPHHPLKQPRTLAHRGLFSLREGILENTLEAFKHAKFEGLGVELDVQVSLDGELYVFHDASLKRLAGIDHQIQAMTSNQLDSIRLTSGQAICRLEEVLALNLPFIMIEIKPTQRLQATLEALHQALDAYLGEFSLCSFDPRIVVAIKKTFPQVMRGLILESSLKQPRPWHERLILEFALLNGVSRPHFMSFDVNHRGVIRWLYEKLKWPSSIWTIFPHHPQKELLKRHRTLIFEREERSE